MNAIIQFLKRLSSDAHTSEQIHKFHGGIHPEGHKALSNLRPIAKLTLPEKLTIPLRQHIGYIPKIKVQVGDRLLKGQLIAEAEGGVSAAIHAPTSGTVSAIAEAIIPHPSGLPDICVTLTPDGKDEWTPLQPLDWRNMSLAEINAKLRISGIVGLGGATFPAHIKLVDGTPNIHTLIINAAECEPYITCDDMLMREYSDEIIQGIEIVKHLLGAKKTILGIEDNKPEAIQAMSNACKAQPDIAIKVVPTLYPSGDARRLIHLLLGVEVPHLKRSTELGIQVFNVATIRSIYRYLTYGEPSISRVVTMTGNVNSAQNFEVLFGTPLMHLVAAAGGTKSDDTYFIMGGPMMGFNLPSKDVPITKAANCIIAATDAMFAPPPAAMPCIRCTRCADACPVNLQPQELYWFAKSDNFEKARDYQLFDCIECGCCTYVCPSNIPLVQYYRYAKSEIIAADKAKEAADVARERNEFRLARIEREKLERAQKHAERAAGAKKEAPKPEELAEKHQDDTSDQDAKKAAIAAAIARAKALKTAEAESGANKQTQNTAKQPEKQTKGTSEQPAQDKQALIAAAIERAKAQKLAAAEKSLTPKNVEKVNPAVEAEIKKIDEIREKVKMTTESQTPE
ncbi:MAG: electron transport complex subunit RsxC [Betaproteobacteria bacterium HGW-Betaproteobacteria-22]|nr:MAG: electron transport complex subunit RsxC [Betaproteobacteria bacterium HGW-Betaproteobacteria-22]